jgi:esterase
MKLSTSILGEGDPLAIMHGLFGSARNWAGAAKALSADWRTVAMDLRNHGASPWADAMDYPAMGADVWETLEAEGADDAPVIMGHSMGGKTAMAATLSRPEDVRALVVVDIAPVAYGHSNEAYLDAMRDMDLSAIARRADADAALAASVPEPPLRAFLLQNLLFEDGAARWRLNLDAIAASMGALTDFPFDAATARYDGPALFIGGSLSEHEDAIKSFFPQARIETIQGAGHWVHAEAPDAFMAALTGFLSDL